MNNSTIYDIAKSCGLSVATVSRVLSGSGYPVSAKSRKIILETAERMNYVPNILGKSLKSGNSRDIGVIVPNISNPYYALLLQGIYDFTLKSGYNIILASSNRSSPAERQNIDLLLQKQVCGIILISIDNDPGKILSAIRYGCKVVLLEQTSDVKCPQISVDFTYGAFLATEHLISLGHKKIGFIGAPLDRPSRKQMLEGYKKALAFHGISINDDYIKISFSESDSQKIYEFENGISAADGFSKASGMPSAYVCINDMTALGAVKAFKQNGFSVPGDISVVGFDNIAFGEMSSPALTTVDSCTYEMGSASADMLISRITGNNEDMNSRVLIPKLIIRESTAKKKIVKTKK